VDNVLQQAVPVTSKGVAKRFAKRVAKRVTKGFIKGLLVYRVG